MPKVLSVLTYPFLKLASEIYRFGQSIDRRIKEKNKKTLSGIVVSIGNMTVGGTGKTPLIIRLTQDLIDMNYHPAILTRGYRGVGEEKSPSQIVHGPMGQKKILVSDEVLLMNERHPDVPIGVGADRWENAKKIKNRHNTDIFLLDDGFQHFQIDRQLDIVCMDATDPFGGEKLLPLGKLREPLEGLKRAGMVVLTRGNLVSASNLEKLKTNLKIHWNQKNIISAQFKYHLYDWAGKPQDPKEALKDKNIVAVSGIGNPRSFENALMQWGAQVIGFRFSDHQNYTGSDLAKIEERALNASAVVVVTEKDKVKLKKLRWGKNKTNSVHVFVLGINVFFEPEDQKIWNQKLKELSKA